METFHSHRNLLKLKYKAFKYFVGFSFLIVQKDQSRNLRGKKFQIFQ